jgi:hypothetical protein
MNVEGALEHGVVELHSERKPWLVAWRGNGSATNFTFAAAHQAYSTAKMEVWNDGTNVTGTVTLATSGVTFGIAPTSGNIIVAWYELA